MVDFLTVTYCLVKQNWETKLLHKNISQKCLKKGPMMFANFSNNVHNNAHYFLIKSSNDRLEAKKDDNASYSKGSTSRIIPNR